MFTGDSSGDWAAKVLYQNGFTNKPISIHSDDSFSLIDAYIAVVLLCVSPQNKPLPSELENCSDYLKNELVFLQNVKVIVCLGRTAFLRICKILGIKREVFSQSYF